MKGGISIRETVIPVSITTEAALRRFIKEDYYLLSIEEPLYSEVKKNPKMQQWFYPDWEPEDHEDRGFFLLKNTRGKCIFDPEKHRVRYLLMNEPLR